MKKRLAKIVPSVLFIGLFVYFYVSNPESLKLLSSFGVVFFVGAIAYQAIVLFITDLFTKTLIEKAGTRLGFIDGYFSAFLSSFGNYFLPLTGGAVLRGVYLKRQHGFSYKKFISISYGSYVISIGVSSLLGIFALLILYSSQEIFVTSLLLVFISMLLVTVFLSSSFANKLMNLVGSTTKNTVIKKVARTLSDIHEGWLSIVVSKRLMTKLVLLTLANMALRLGFFYLTFNMLGTDVSLSSVFIFNTLITLSMYLTITPGSIGIRETLLLLYSSSLGLPPEAILAASLVDRASLMVSLSSLYIVFQQSSKYKVSRAFAKKQQDNMST
jgi:uncharacterized protein (TIRG00374 family)